MEVYFVNISWLAIPQIGFVAALHVGGHLTALVASRELSSSHATTTRFSLTTHCFLTITTVFHPCEKYRQQCTFPRERWWRWRCGGSWSITVVSQSYSLYAKKNSGLTSDTFTSSFFSISAARWKRPSPAKVDSLSALGQIGDAPLPLLSSQSLNQSTLDLRRRHACPLPQWATAGWGGCEWCHIKSTVSQEPGS